MAFEERQAEVDRVEDRLEALPLGRVERLASWGSCGSGVGGHGLEK